MKLDEIGLLQEKLFAVTGTGIGIVDHTHRVDTSVRSGKTTVDDQHYHMYNLGDPRTTETVPVPPDAKVKPHDHTLPPLVESAAHPGKVIHFLKTLEKEDFQNLANPLNKPKPNEPLRMRVEDEHGSIKVGMTFYHTKDAYAIEVLGRRIHPMLKELGVNPNRVHYHVMPYQEPMEPVPGELARPPAVDFEYVEDKGKLTKATAVISNHVLFGS